MVPTFQSKQDDPGAHTFDTTPYQHHEGHRVILGGRRSAIYLSYTRFWLQNGLLLTHIFSYFPKTMTASFWFEKEAWKSLCYTYYKISRTGKNESSATWKAVCSELEATDYQLCGLRQVTSLGLNFFMCKPGKTITNDKEFVRKHKWKWFVIWKIIYKFEGTFYVYWGRII